MGEGAVLDLAQAGVKIACAALHGLQKLELWRIPELDLLALAQELEGLTRLGFGAQVRVAGEVDNQRTAEQFGSASTVALLRETLTISATDARTRVHTAKMIHPQVMPSGAKSDPVIPELAQALADGVIGVEQTRTIVATIRAATGHADTGMLEAAKKVLVKAGSVTEPKPFAALAKSVALALDLDGKPDKDPADRVELTIGSRNPDTGLTGSADNSTTSAPNCSGKRSKDSPTRHRTRRVNRTGGVPRFGGARRSKKSSPGI